MPVKIDQLKKSKTTTLSSVEGAAEKVSIFQKDIQLFNKGLGLQFKEQLYAELAVLLSSGLDIQTSFRLIEESQRKKVARETIDLLIARIMEGSSMSEAMKASPHFSDYEIFSIQIGEESGKLIGILEELSSFYAKSIKYRQQLMGALAYPAFVIGFSVIVIFFLLKFLVPMFADIYARFDGDLPAITQSIITASNWLGANLNLILLSLIVVGGIIYSQRKKTKMRAIGAKMLLSLPIFGGIYHKIYLARFSQAMYFLLSSKVPLLKTVGLVKRMVGFYPVETSLTIAEEEILNGALLNKTLSKSSFYPNRLIALLRVGEETSTLDEMFRKIAEEYNKEVERKTATIGSLIEPVLIVCLGGVVGFILVAMYLPLFQLSVGVG